MLSGRKKDTVPAAGAGLVGRCPREQDRNRNNPPGWPVKV
ncbi:hypothetical protein NY78_0902 [Desulfovibrio sp. TomC]|nr:hypothetical protein NY78_0902 [Desulfovibrio sp. TomC]